MSYKSIPIGTFFSKLKVLRSASPILRADGKFAGTSLCLCECGKETIAINGNLKSGNTKSCGCLKMVAPQNITHGQTMGRKSTHYYAVYRSMLQRCYDENCKSYKDYGGRGITVCERWRCSFENFREDMRECPAGLLIDRINNDGTYSCGKCEECLRNGWPMNCRWVTRKESNRNTRKNRFVILRGVNATVAEHCETFQKRQERVIERLNYGWSPERAFFEPPRPGNYFRGKRKQTALNGRSSKLY